MFDFTCFCFFVQAAGALSIKIGKLWLELYLFIFCVYDCLLYISGRNSEIF